KLSLAPLDAPKLLESAQELIEPEAMARSVEITTAAEPASLEGDSSLLAAALINLLKNAVQASAPGQQISLTGKAVGDRYWIDVTDQGSGVALEARDKLFEPFFTTREKG